MSTDVQLTGAGYPLPIHGKEYLARTLTDRDHAELDAYVQSEIMKITRATLEDSMTQAERQEYISAGLLAVSGLTWGSNEGRRVMASVKGMCRLCYQMIKYYHPKEEFNTLYEYVRRVNNEDREIEEVQKVIDTIDEAFLVLNTTYEKDGEVETSAEDEGDSAKEPKSN